jgi:hypothetical protein
MFALLTINGYSRYMIRWRSSWHTPAFDLWFSSSLSKLFAFFDDLPPLRWRLISGAWGTTKLFAGSSYWTVASGTRGWSKASKRLKLLLGDIRKSFREGKDAIGACSRCKTLSGLDDTVRTNKCNLHRLDMETIDGSIESYDYSQWPRYSVENRRSDPDLRIQVGWNQRVICICENQNPTSLSNLHGAQYFGLHLQHYSE